MSAQPHPQSQSDNVTFFWNIPPVSHPGLLLTLDIVRSHTHSHTERVFLLFFLPDLPTPALPKTASFTSGLLAMTAALQPVKISDVLSEHRGQPFVLGKQLLEWNSRCYLCFDAKAHFNQNFLLLFIIIDTAHSCVWFIKQCESCMSFPACLSAFAICFGQKAFNNYFCLLRKYLCILLFIYLFLFKQVFKHLPQFFF